MTDLSPKSAAGLLRYMARLILCLASLSFVSGCIATVPLTVKLSEPLMVSVKPSKTKMVSYRYISYVKDTDFESDGKEPPEVRRRRHGHAENTALNRMIQEYLKMKFEALDDKIDPQIKVFVRDFRLERSCRDSSGKKVFDLLLGGDRNVTLTAVLDLAFEISEGGTPVTKSVTVSSDVAQVDHVNGLLTPPSEKKCPPKEDNGDLIVSELMNAVNNKAIIRLNQFLESNQL